MKTMIPCMCCLAPLEFENPKDAPYDKDVGYVCEPCRVKLRAADAWLTKSKIVGCVTDKKTNNR